MGLHLWIISYPVAKQLWSLTGLHSDYSLKIVDGLDVFLSNPLTIVVIRMNCNCIALHCHCISSLTNKFV